jgi:hypothetical protein
LPNRFERLPPPLSFLTDAGRKFERNLALLIVIIGAIGIPTLAVGAAIIALCCMAIYWSLEVRKGLSSRIFREQTLGTVFISILLAFFSFTVFMDGLFISPLLNVTIGKGPLGTGLVIAIGLTIIYWLDVSIRAAQRNDPLMRDPLRWRYVRWLLWGFSIIEIPLTQLYTWFPNSSIIVQLANDAYLFWMAIVIVSGAVYLPLSLHNTPDVSSKAHFKWIVLFLVSIFIGAFVINPVAVGGGIAIGILFGSYCIYRSARALGRLQHRTMIKTKPDQ